MAGLSIGIAVGADVVTGVARAGSVRHTASAPFEASGSGEERAASLNTAFEAVSSRLAVALGKPVSGADAHIALLPPHSDARLVPLPPLRPKEAEAVLRRDAGRYFLGGSGPRIVAAKPPDETGKPAFGASASATVVEASRAATVAAGWKPTQIVPGGAAWLAAARQGRGTRVVVAVEDNAAHVIRVAKGEIEVVRRVPADLVDEVVQATGEPDGTVSVYAERGAREPVVRALSGAGWKVAEDTAEFGSAAEAAAAFAEDADLELVPPVLAAERKDRLRRVTMKMATAAGIMIVIAAGLELWGAKREVDQLAARRDAIREQVQPLLSTRDSLVRLAERGAVIHDLERDTPQFTRSLFEISMLLPMDTHLTMLEVNGDTLYIHASGARAGWAIQSLREAETLSDVQLLGSVEREVEGGTTTQETFRVRAVIVRSGPDEVAAQASRPQLAGSSR